jgi:hypothetical protein
MTSTAEWLPAFPIHPAKEAVEALREAWSRLAKTSRPNFNPNPKTKEPNLTKLLKMYVERITARERGLLGMWAAENVIGEIDPATGAVLEERRTDIVYGWNDADRSFELVFEFKRLSKQKKHRMHYLRENGLGRFVTGIYSRHQSIAAMVGVLLDPEDEVVPPIRKAFEDPALSAELRLRPTITGEPIERPSILFGAADFDSEHERDADLAPTHGHIRVSHFFLPFGYLTTTSSPGRKTLK